MEENDKVIVRRGKHKRYGTIAMHCSALQCILKWTQHVCGIYSGYYEAACVKPLLCVIRIDTANSNKDLHLQ